MKKKILNIILIVIIVMIVSITTTYATNYLYNSNEVYYDNSESNLTSSDVQGAIDELYTEATNYSSINTRLTNLENSVLTLDKVYPVGSIYISTTLSTVSQVASALGGTWQVYGTGRTLVGINTSDSNYNTIGKTGGSNSENYTPAGKNTGGAVQSHTLTISEMPSHSHVTDNFVINSAAGPNTFSIGSSVATLSYSTSSSSTHYSTNAAGGGKSHTHTFTQPTFTGTSATISHLQPYITVYMYKRIS